MPAPRTALASTLVAVALGFGAAASAQPTMSAQPAASPQGPSSRPPAGPPPGALHRLVPDHHHELHISAGTGADEGPSFLGVALGYSRPAHGALWVGGELGLSPTDRTDHAHGPVFGDINARLFARLTTDILRLELGAMAATINGCTDDACTSGFVGIYGRVHLGYKYAFLSIGGDIGTIFATDAEDEQLGTSVENGAATAGGVWYLTLAIPW